jgi:hypothetical protein
MSYSAAECAEEVVPCSLVGWAGRHTDEFSEVDRVLRHSSMDWEEEEEEVLGNCLEVGRSLLGEMARCS